MYPRTLNPKVPFIYWPPRRYIPETGGNNSVTCLDFEKIIDGFCKWLLTVPYGVPSVTALHIVSHCCTTVCYYCEWQRLFYGTVCCMAPHVQCAALPATTVLYASERSWVCTSAILNGEKKKRKTNKHHCDFMWDDFRRARPSRRSLHHQIKMNLIFHPSGLLYGDAHLSHRWGFCQSNVWQPVGWALKRDLGGFKLWRISIAHVVWQRISSADPAITQVDTLVLSKHCSSRKPQEIQPV